MLMAEGNSTSMGMLSTVVSDGASDAVRNPALLGFQKAQYTVAAWGMVVPYSAMDFTPEKNNESYDLLSERIFSAGAAFSFKAGSSVVGFALSNVEDEDFFSDSELKMQGVFYVEDIAADVNVTQNIVIKKYFPALVFSASFPLSNSAFFGLQGNIGVGITDQSQHTFATLQTPIPFELSSDGHSKTKAFFFEAGAGFIQKFAGGHVGLLMRSGKLYFDSRNADFSSLYADSQSDSTNNDLRYKSGLECAAGFYTKPFESFGFAFETGYRFPAESRNNTLEEEDGHIEVTPYLVTIGHRFQFKSGAEFTGITNLTLSAGMLLFFEKKEKQLLLDRDQSDGPRNEYEEISGVLLTAGGAYRLSDAYLFSFTASYMRVYNEQRNDSEKTGTIKIQRMMMLFGVNYSF